MSAPFTSVSSTQSGESSPCVLQSEWVLERTHSGPSDYMSDVNSSMTESYLDGHDFEPDYFPSDPNGPMIFHRNSYLPDACVINQTSPHVVVVNDSMSMQSPSDCQTSHDFVMDDDTPSMVFMDDDPPSMYGGDSSPYYGSSVLGSSFYSGYNIGSPRTEGDMMMRAYLASRRG
jgi:hypothetical protein